MRIARPGGHAAIIALLLLLAMPGPARGGLWDSLQKAMPETVAKAVSPGSGLSTTDIVAGLKEALVTAASHASSSLGAAGGYLDDPLVRIPMPERLASMEKAVRLAGQGKMADEFIASMNRAAEQAAPEALDIFTRSVKAMSFEDARAILGGPDDAATSYLRTTSTGELVQRFRPIVEKATASVGVTRRYKDMAGSLSSLAALTGVEMDDLDGYVTDKAVQGLFAVMAQEEKDIRENPAARTTALLQKVFGSSGD